MKKYPSQGGKAFRLARKTPLGKREDAAYKAASAIGSKLWNMATKILITAPKTAEGLAAHGIATCVRELDRFDVETFNFEGDVAGIIQASCRIAKVQLPERLQRGLQRSSRAWRKHLHAEVKEFGGRS
jgi:hypothetical protein